MGSSLSISVPGLKPEEATNCLVASAMDKGYEVEKIHSDDLKFRIQPINESDPTPTHEVLIIKGHGVFNINHTQRRIGQLPVVHKVESNEQKVEQKSEQMDDVDLKDESDDETVEDEKIEKIEEVEDLRPIVHFASIERYCAESDIARV
tara:strand:+ start:246 stop:692 length:447 start_codon:yes stop_codon:yes gene_type:complete